MPVALSGASHDDESVASDSPEKAAQWLSALGRANNVRSDRARVKRELAAGTLSIAEVLADPPACVATAPVRQLLLALPKLGPVRARRLLAYCQIPEAKTVAGLSDRQRAVLIEQLSPSRLPGGEPHGSRPDAAGWSTTAGRGPS